MSIARMSSVAFRGLALRAFCVFAAALFVVGALSTQAHLVSAHQGCGEPPASLDDHDGAPDHDHDAPERDHVPHPSTDHLVVAVAGTSSQHGPDVVSLALTEVIETSLSLEGEVSFASLLEEEVVVPVSGIATGTAPRAPPTA